MNCIETLARVDVLCLDKTGTLTEAAMDVENVIPLTQEEPERLEHILAAYFSCIQPENDTAKALTEMFAGESDWECTKRIPFTSATKWSAAVFREHGCFVVGAPEFTLGSRYGEVQDTAEGWTGKGYRVLLIAQYSGDPEEFLEPGKLRPLALIVLSNRIRPDAPDTIAYFAQQGVAIKVISGDNPLTVSQIALRCGIAGGENYADVSGLETDGELLDALARCTVFGRVTPDKKKRLIQLLKQARHTVAMTGDGVNDVLAMKEANCSLAMASGAQAACQISQLVLLKSNFSAIPHIVGEGRRVINNIQRAATLFLVKNIFSLGLALLSLVTAWPYPIIPIQLTMISSLTIGIPSFFLAMEPNYARFKGHFLRGVLRRAFPGGLTNIFVVSLAQAFGFPSAQTATMCTALLAAVGLLVLFETCKPFDKFRKLIWAAVAIALVLCFALFSWFFGFDFGNGQSLLVLLGLLILTPGVFYGTGRLFDWGEKLYARFRG